MKKFLLIFALTAVSASFVTSRAQHISVSININSQPAWGPVGYDYVDYYYIPEINVYYNVPMAMYYYWDRGRWISAHYLPYVYRSYNLYSMYKVVLNHHDPWRYNRTHIRDYARYKGVRNQHVIYYANDNRYAHSKKNTASWYKDNSNNRRSVTPDDYRSNKRSTSRNSGSYDQTRSASTNNRTVTRGSATYDRSQTRAARSDDNKAYNSRSGSDSRANANVQSRAAQNQSRSSAVRTGNTGRSASTATRSATAPSRTYTANNNSSGENRSSTRSSTQRTSTRSQSDRTTGTRSSNR